MRMFLLLMSLSLTMAQVPLPAPAVWLEPLGNSLGLLLKDGSVFVYEHTLNEVAAEWQSDWLLACNGQLLGVNKNGNLAIAAKAMTGPEVAVHSRPACLPNGDVVALAPDGKALLLLGEQLVVKAQVSLSALPDAEIVVANLVDDSPVVILLTDPSSRYPHGVLGDDLEAISVSAYNPELELLSQFVLPEPFVFEQRRVTPLLAQKRGVLATRSSAQTGAGVIFLEWRDNAFQLSAEALAIGTGYRWLNLFASNDGTAYAIRTPHIGGILQRYHLSESVLELEQFELGITNHVIGSRNLDLAVLLEASADKTLLAAPSQQLDHMRLIECAAICEVSQEWPLSERLSSNIVTVQLSGQRYLAAADTRGKLWLWTY
jgi:hypothetical protein